jgi:hypothetical protein
MANDDEEQQRPLRDWVLASVGDNDQPPDLVENDAALPALSTTVERYTAYLSLGDELAIAEQAADLQARSARLKLARQAPTLDTRCRALHTIVDFARRNGRKVYGGFALHAASCSASGMPPPLYRWDEASGQPPPDVEFYSPDPARDAMDLADRLLAEGHRYVQAREANHRDTITVTLDFVRVCDITYVPPRVYDAIPTVAWAVDPVLRCVSPAFAFIDVLRQIADPVGSHWRLGHVISRLSVLQRVGDVMPLVPEDDVATTHWPPTAETHAVEDRIVHAAVTHAALNPTLAYMGTHAVRVLFAAHHGEGDGEVGGDDLSPGLRAALDAVDAALGIVVVSVDFDRDVATICGRLQPLFGARRVDHEPFMDLMGRRCVLWPQQGGAGTRPRPRPIVTVVDYAGVAVPVAVPAAPGKPAVAGFCYIAMNLLVTSFLARVNEDVPVEAATARLATAMVRARSTSAAAALVAADPASILRDIHLDVLGTSVANMEMHMRATDQRRAQLGHGHGAVWFKYAPPASRVVFKYLPRTGQPISAGGGHRGGGGGGGGGHHAPPLQRPVPSDAEGAGDATMRRRNRRGHGHGHGHGRGAGPERSQPPAAREGVQGVQGIV